ncbi:aspartate-tRNA ligase [Acanthamoeba castellanii str. Neff]|uniref:Aspartate-tRNA ligase n=1 Tax=Acanthamoeba castellanii (strain ATCC 30010 / Neff) TaxID=1257118 RepID=L8H7B9_ACACF|nr:aspartate-tRNA ligase [Acanthamoeba castellanii str. Neff]ELR21439.1 aspartate-tRNA ligase [Acanthamoeba castellanii str. Neff]
MKARLGSTGVLRAGRTGRAASSAAVPARHAAGRASAPVREGISSSNSRPGAIISGLRWGRPSSTWLPSSAAPQWPQLRSFSTSSSPAPKKAGLGSTTPALDRTHHCGRVTAADAGTSVRLCGWLTASRDFGGVLFLVVKDHTGPVQVLVDEKRLTPGLREQVASWRIESVVTVTGKVQLRPASMQNKDMPTGEIEIVCEDIALLNPTSHTSLPFPSWSSPLHGDERDALPPEELRLRYRFLDIRRPYIQDNLRLRSQLSLAARNYLHGQGFSEIETPTLFRSTPEGAREFIVPTRTRGKFYSLPQSPQQYKQLLMIDMEMAFVGDRDVCNLTEGLVRTMWKTAGHTLPDPFPRMSFRHAMETYGSDKPDTRYDLLLRDVTDILQQSRVNVLTAPLTAGASTDAAAHKKGPGRCIKAINVRGMADLSREDSDGIQKRARDLGGKGVVEIRCGPEGKWRSPIEKHLTDGERRRLGDALEAQEGDLLLLCSGPERDDVSLILGGIRSHCAKLMKRRGKLSIPDDQYNFLWVEEFPLFSFESASPGEAKRIVTTHHPFTAPHPDDIDLLMSSDAEHDLLRVRGLHYDCVVNGVELGGGSIRVHNEAMQRHIFRVLGMSDNVMTRFQHLLDALGMGCPPHGGLAIGFDRLMAILCHAESLREVIAFPKTATGNELMTGAPSEPGLDELKEYHISVAAAPPS